MAQGTLPPWQSPIHKPVGQQQIVCEQAHANSCLPQIVTAAADKLHAACNRTDSTVYCWLSAWSLSCRRLSCRQLMPPRFPENFWRDLLSRKTLEVSCLLGCCSCMLLSLLWCYCCHAVIGTLACTVNPVFGQASCTYITAPTPVNDCT